MRRQEFRLRNEVKRLQNLLDLKKEKLELMRVKARR